MRTLLRHIRLVLVLPLLLFTQLMASAAVVRSLTDTWLVYEPEKRDFLPYDFQQHRNTSTVHTWLYPRKDNYWLAFKVPVGTAVYVQNRLWYMVQDSNTVYLKLADIFSKEPDSLQALMLTLNTPRPPLDISQVAIVNEPGGFKAWKGGAVSDFQLLPISKQALKDERALLLLFLLMAYLGLRWLGGREFADLFSISSMVANPLEGYGAASKRVFSPVNVALMVLNTVAICYVFVLSDHYQQAVLWLQQELGLDSLVALSWVLPLALGLAGVAYVLAKYVLLVIMGALFQGSRLATAHYLEFIRLSTWLALLSVLVTVLVYNTYLLSLEQLWQLATALLALVMLIRVLKVVQAARLMPEFRLLYLIAYLCTTEIVPMVLLMRAMMPQKVGV